LTNSGTWIVAPVSSVAGLLPPPDAVSPRTPGSVCVTSSSTDAESWTSDGAVIDRTFRAGEKFRPVRTEARKMQFLYADGTDAHFMDEGSYEQIAIPEPSLADTLKWVKPSETVDLLFIDDEPSDIQLAASVELEVTHTEPGVKGDTASGGGNKPATLETGATVNVPLFVNIGDKIKVDTRSGSYMSRA